MPEIKAARNLTLSLKTVSSDFSDLDNITVKFEALIGVTIWGILKTLDYGGGIMVPFVISLFLAQSRQNLVWLENLTRSLQNHPKLFKMTSLWRVASLLFQCPYPLKFHNSLFLDRHGLNLVQGTNSETTFYITVGHFFDFPSEKASDTP